jgi:hypothetical protein
MKKIGILTFHASHNYGSMLQAFALQQALKKLGYEPKIINLRTERQKKMYSYFFDRKTNSLKLLIKKMLLSPYKKGLKIQHDKFESFLKNYLDCTEEYSRLEQLKEKELNFDSYIVGSDQVWNIRCPDFDLAYLLPFVRNSKKIAYAPSFGPRKSNYIKFLEFLELIKQFDYISVREKQNFYYIAQKLGREIFVALDPTLLLTKEEWFKYIKEEPLVKQDYIFLYSFTYKKEAIDMAEQYSKKLNIPIVVSYFVDGKLYYKMLYSNKYIKFFEIGPLDFLNLIKNAKLIVSGSFHATLFSMLFGKEVFSPSYEKDYRIYTFMKNFKNLQQEREKSLNFLKEALR